MPVENDKLQGETEEYFGGSRLGKFLFGLSWVILLCLIVSFFWRIEVYEQDGTLASSRWAWEVTVGCVIAWIGTAYLSYRFAKRGKEGKKGE